MSDNPDFDKALVAALAGRTVVHASAPARDTIVLDLDGGGQLHVQAGQHQGMPYLQLLPGTQPGWQPGATMHVVNNIEAVWLSPDQLLRPHAELVTAGRGDVTVLARLARPNAAAIDSRLQQQATHLVMWRTYANAQAQLLAMEETQPPADHPERDAWDVAWEAAHETSVAAYAQLVAVGQIIPPLAPAADPDALPTVGAAVAELATPPAAPDAG